MATASRAERSSGAQAARSSDAGNIIAFPDRVATTPSAIARLLEQDIIPRLLLSHRRPGSAPAREALAQADAAPAAGRIPHEAVSRFAQAATSETADELLVRVAEWRAKGWDDQTLCMELLAPAAKLLGFMWEEDLCGFTDVTLGLGRLQQVLQAVAQRTGEVATGSARKALLGVVPGEQHVFGMLLAADAFRRRGWHVAAMTDGSAEDLRRAVAIERFDLIGLSAVQEVDLDFVRTLVSSMRRASLNADVRIVVGGRVFDLDPSLVAVVGADAGGEDAKTAAGTAERLVGARVRPS